MCEYRELGSRAFKNFMSPCNSLPRFFEDVVLYYLLFSFQ